MAIAFDAASSSNGQNVSSVTWSHTCTGSNRFLFVGVGLDYWTTTGVSTVTYNAVSCTEKWEVQGGSANRINGGWYKTAPATGANNIVVTLDNSPDDIFVGGMSFTGVDQTTPMDTEASTYENWGSSVSVDVSSAVNDWVIDNVHVTGNYVITEGAGQTNRWEQEQVSGQSAGGSTEAGATTVTMSWSWPTDTAATIVGCSINPAGAGPAGIEILRRRREGC